MDEEISFDLRVKRLKRIDKRFGDSSAVKTLETISSMHDDPEDFFEKVHSYASVLKGGHFRVGNYLKAVQYVGLRATGLSMYKSYCITFPDRLNKRHRPLAHPSSFYDKNKLVQDIMISVQVPLHVLMIGERIAAANVLARLMINGETERIQMESADKLLAHIKVPESIKMELDVGFKADAILTDIDTKLNSLADVAQARIMSGGLTPLEVIER